MQTLEEAQQMTENWMQNKFMALPLFCWRLYILDFFGVCQEIGVVSRSGSFCNQVTIGEIFLSSVAYETCVL